MFAFPNNIRFQFRDTDRDARVIVSSKDYNKMIKSVASKAQISKTLAKEFIHNSFINEINKVYGSPSKLTIIIDTQSVTIQ